MDVGGQDSGVETGSGVNTPLNGSSLPDDDMHVDHIETEQASPAVNGSAAISGEASPAGVEGDDVEMGDAEPANGAVGPLLTPPEDVAPVASTAEAVEAAQQHVDEEADQKLAEMKLEDAAVKAEEEGRMEREVLNTEGDARAEGAKRDDEDVS